MGTIAKGVIPSIAKEGDFATIDGRKYSRTTTTGSCAIE
jgi:hypothetical protein